MINRVRICGFGLPSIRTSRTPSITDPKATVFEKRTKVPIGLAKIPGKNFKIGRLSE